MSNLEKDMTKKEWWGWMYGWDEYIIPWEEFDEEYKYKCERCHGWYREPCICYAR